jgi:phosphoserine phosphatase
MTEPAVDPGPEATTAASPTAPAGAAPVVAADLEGTCTAGETWRGVARWLSAHGRAWRYRRFFLPRVAALPLVRVGLVERQAFRNRWIRDLARLLDGLNEAELDALAAEVVATELWPKRRVAVLDELARAAADGARVVIASGTYEPVLAAFAARLPGGPAGPVALLGTPLEMRDGRTTGRLAGPIGTGAPKAARVLDLAAGAELAVAYGDSLADAPLLRAARQAVAVAPDDELGPLAATSGWRILDAPAEGA